MVSAPRKSIVIAGLISLLAGATKESYRTATRSSFTDGSEGGVMSCWLGYSPEQTYSRIEKIIETTSLLGVQVRSKVRETKEYTYPCFKHLEGSRYELLASLL